MESKHIFEIKCEIELQPLHCSQLTHTGLSFYTHFSTIRASSLELASICYLDAISSTQTFLATMFSKQANDVECSTEHTSHQAFKSPQSIPVSREVRSKAVNTGLES